MVQGYEDGFDDIIQVHDITVTPNTNAAEYNGEYEASDKAARGAIAAVVIMDLAGGK